MEILDFYKELLLKQYDKKNVDEILQGLNSKKNVTLRINTIKSNKEEVINNLKENNITFHEIKWYKDALVIENSVEQDIQKLDIYNEGKIYLQSLSSMIPPIILNPKEGENILDMCAAPGGKTTQISAIANNKAYITAVEKNKIRGERLKYNLQKQGVTSVNIMLEDAKNLSDMFKFDKILLDAPCSGSGTHNVFKKNFTKELINKSSRTQEILLKKALRILKPGGEMVYSTCSILKQENEDILEKVLKNTNCELVKVQLENEIPILLSKYEEVKVIKPTELFEGFFVAKIKKN